MKERPYVDIDIIIPPLEIIIEREFVYRPWYKVESFLKKKYVDEGLSIAQIAEQIKCSKSAVRNGLKKFKIPIREACKPHRRPAQVPTDIAKKMELLSLMQVSRKLSRPLRRWSMRVSLIGRFASS